GKRRQEKLAALVREAPQRNDTDRHARCEAERSLKGGPDKGLEHSLVEKTRYLLVRGNCDGARTGDTSECIREREIDYRRGVIRVRDRDSRIERTGNFGIDAAGGHKGCSRHAGFADENVIVTESEYGDTRGCGHSRIRHNARVAGSLSSTAVRADGRTAAVSRCECMRRQIRRRRRRRGSSSGNFVNV